MKVETSSSNGQTPAWKRFTLLCAVESKIKNIENGLNLASVFIIMFLMFFATAEILGRYIFNNPIPGHVEIVELIMAGVVFFGIAYTERVGGHVRMELFVTKVLKGRAYHIAEVITATLSLFVYIVILVYTFKFALFSYQIGDVTVYINWPTWPSKFAIPLGSLFLCIRFAIEIIQHLSQAIVGGEIRDMGQG